MKGKPTVLTAILVLLLALFGVLDLVAHLAHYRYGLTFSALVWSLEAKYPPIRVLIGAASLTLFTHLTFRFP